MINYKKEFMKLEEEKNTLRKLQSKLSNLEEEISITKDKYNNLKASLANEKKDVDKLESISLSYILHKLKGNMDEKLTKEKYEYLEAQAKFIEVEDYLNRLISNKESLNKEICDIGNIRKKYNELLEKASDYISRLNNEQSQEVTRLQHKIQKLHLEKKEVEEAINEGENLLPTIDNALSSLNSAENWGIYDMIGGGFFATMGKRSNMNDAADSINSIKVILNRYNAELNDLSTNINISLDLDGFSGAMDYLFDNFFTDYIIQNKIESALRSAKVLKYKVIEIQKNLKSQLVNLDFSINSLKKDLEEAIVSAKAQSNINNEE
ncbi:hypothetical protein [Clostridium sp.]|uniref:coiled-coil domain-containing protein n=1 Tax=Clostridium sp. TaxID=1506 RepID=UPI001E07BE6C|nr:hypothetical protein [Clostridium sp.]MBS5938495.1 hypothetical protein [Clostridium sp.]